MNLSTWHKTGKYFLYKKKHRIFYREEVNDSKEVLLLLHGFPTASWDWNKVWLSLSAKYHIIAIDFIGFGFSDKPKRYKYSTHDQADLVEAFLKEKQHANIRVISHDFGDTVLQELLARYIDRIKNNKKSIVYNSICMLNGGILPKYHQPRPIQKALISPLGILITPFLSKKKLEINFKAIFGKNTQPTEEEINEFYYLINYNKGKYIFHKLIRYMSDRKKYGKRWVHALKESPIPLCLINGNADPISGKHLSDMLKKIAPNIKVFDLATVGHYPQTEAPKLVLEAFFEFNN